jgi:hypothetical protein
VLRDEAIEGLLAHLDAMPVGSLEITVDHGMYRVEITSDDNCEWADHPNLTDAMTILLGLIS